MYTKGDIFELINICFEKKSDLELNIRSFRETHLQHLRHFLCASFQKTNVDMISEDGFRYEHPLDMPRTCRYSSICGPVPGAQGSRHLGKHVRLVAVAVRTVTQVVRLNSSLTLETTHKRLYGALDKFNSQMTKPPLPAANGGGNLPHAEGLCLLCLPFRSCWKRNVEPLLKPTYRAGFGCRLPLSVSGKGNPGRFLNGEKTCTVSVRVIAHRHDRYPCSSFAPHTKKLA